MNELFTVSAARDEARGAEAVQKLKEEGLEPKFHQLDITDTNSIARLKEFLLSKYQGLDLLVNNAGFAYKVLGGLKYVYIVHFGKHCVHT